MPQRGNVRDRSSFDRVGDHAIEAHVIE
jgi:hypothetical protein